MILFTIRSIYLLILILPILSAFIIGFCGFYFGRNLSLKISLICMFFAVLISFFLYFEICLSDTIVIIKLFTWMQIGIFNFKFGLLFDNLTCTMLLIICLISFFVHIYSVEYMKNDPFFCRFVSYLSLFTFFMEILVTSDNLIQMFIGWEGVGLCSYLLINFWYSRILANKAALKAMIMNRISDIFLLIGILLILLKLKTIEYLIIFDLIKYIEKDIYFFLGYQFNFIDVIALLFLIGAVGKSAQLGFHTWLPDAMEGPTPVSALLHAATMVTAGVFLILRCSIIFSNSEAILFTMAIWGGLTAFFSAFVSLFQDDIKKIIAYSTCSQLGYMVFACGVSNYAGAIFHLFNHAFFKALLFLGAGIIIHGLFNEQDLRKMGRLTKIFPITYICLIIGFLAISGFPFYTGFYSKDFILEFTYSKFFINGSIIYILGILTACCTAGYCSKILYIIFMNLKFMNFNKIILKAHEGSIMMLISIISLAMFSLVIGYIMHDLMIGIGSFFWGNNFNFSYLEFLEIEYIKLNIKLLPLFISVLGYLIIILFLNFLKNNEKESYFLKNNWKLFTIFPYFFFNAGFFNYLYNEIFLFIFKISYLINIKWLDKGYLEFLGPYGSYKLVKSFINKFKFSIFINYLLLFVFFLYILIIAIVLFCSYILCLFFIGFVILVIEIKNI